jgi:hypothetical protein
MTFVRLPCAILAVGLLAMAALAAWALFAFAEIGEYTATHATYGVWMRTQLFGVDFTPDVAWTRLVVGSIGGAWFAAAAIRGAQPCSTASPAREGR